MKYFKMYMISINYILNSGKTAEPHRADPRDQA